jgi:hypothetical protein
MAGQMIHESRAISLDRTFIRFFRRLIFTAALITIS